MSQVLYHKRYFTFVLLFFIETTLAQNFDKKMLTYQPDFYLDIQTPFGEKIIVGFISEEEAKRILDTHPYKVISHLLINSLVPIYEFENGEIYFSPFAGYQGYIFSSLIDLIAVYNVKYYENFYVKKIFTKENKQKATGYDYYYLVMKNDGLKKLKTQKYIFDTNYNRSIFQTLIFENGSYLHFQNDNTDSGYWLPDKEQFEKFYKQFHDIEELSEPQPEEEIEKKILLQYPKSTTIVRLLRSKAESYLKEAKEELKDFRIPVCFDRFLNALQKQREEQPEEDQGMNIHYGRVYLLKDNRVLVVWDTSIWDITMCLIFKNMEEFYETMDLEGSKTFDQVYFRDITNADGFKARIPDVKQDLIQLLQLDVSKLDFSSNSLDYLDKVLNQYFSNNFFQSQILVPVLIYFGEVLKKEMGGEWVILKNDEGWWQPAIKKQNGQRLEFIQQVIDQIDEQEYNYRSCLICVYVAFSMNLKVDK